MLGTLLAAFTSSFSGLLVARVIQGIGSAGPRVVTVSVIRDVCSGRQMGRVMSLTMMVFLVVPMVAPTIGQTVTLLGSWRSPFYVLLAAGLAATLWAASRLPETGRTSQGQEAPPKLVGSFKATIFNRQTMAYGIASGFMTGPMLTYIASAQQIFVEIYGLGLILCCLWRRRTRLGRSVVSQREESSGGSVSGVCRTPLSSASASWRC